MLGSAAEIGIIPLAVTRLFAPSATALPIMRRVNEALSLSLMQRRLGAHACHRNCTRTRVSYVIGVSKECACLRTPSFR